MAWMFCHESKRVYQTDGAAAVGMGLIKTIISVAGRSAFIPADPQHPGAPSGLSDILFHGGEFERESGFEIERHSPVDAAFAQPQRPRQDRRTWRD